VGNNFKWDNPTSIGQNHCSNKGADTRQVNSSAADIRFPQQSLDATETVLKDLMTMLTLAYSMIESHSMYIKIENYTFLDGNILYLSAA
jgi:hypothetical protein